MSLPDRATAQTWAGYGVVDSEGVELGTCTRVYADLDTGVPEWLLLRRDDGADVVVPLVDATEADGRVRVSFAAADIAGAPSIADEAELSPAEESALYEHYGVPYSSSSSDSLLPADVDASGGTDGDSMDAQQVAPTPVDTAPVAVTPVDATPVDVPPVTVGPDVTAEVEPADTTIDADSDVLVPAASTTGSIADPPTTPPPAVPAPRPPAREQVLAPYEQPASGRPWLAWVAGLATVLGILVARRRKKSLRAVVLVRRPTRRSPRSARSAPAPRPAAAPVSTTRVKRQAAATGLLTAKAATGAANASSALANAGGSAARAAGQSAVLASRSAGKAALVTGRVAGRAARLSGRAAGQTARLSGRAAGQTARLSGRAAGSTARLSGRAVAQATRAAAVGARSMGSVARTATDTERRLMTGARMRSGKRGTPAVAEAAASVTGTVSRLQRTWRSTMSKLKTGLALGVGYVLGARAGRARYEQIKQVAAKVGERPEVQQAGDRLLTAAGTKLSNAPAPVRRFISKSGPLGGRITSGSATPATSEYGDGFAPDTPGDIGRPPIPPAGSAT